MIEENKIVHGSALKISGKSVDEFSKEYQQFLAK